MLTGWVAKRHQAVRKRRFRKLKHLKVNKAFVYDTITWMKSLKKCQWNGLRMENIWPFAHIRFKRRMISHRSSHKSELKEWNSVSAWSIFEFPNIEHFDFTDRSIWSSLERNIKIQYSEGAVKIRCASYIRAACGWTVWMSLSMQTMVISNQI